MAVNTSPIFVGAIRNAGQVFENADGAGVYKTLVTAGVNGSKIESISAVSSDTAIKVLQLAIVMASVNYLIGEVAVPIGAGTNGGSVKAKDVLNITDLPWLRADADGRCYIYLAPGASLAAMVETSAVSASKQVALLAQVGDF